MIVNKEINDRNRYVLPDLIIIAIFNSPNVPENVPKQLVLTCNWKRSRITTDESWI